ncbi:gliding motility-associated C-terminal domain-containing protein [Sinomicrobium soli]|uniref:gliding motility-associated C-terminal domain-containing protein n=1 Tax=Sinomicrobium sp. N-1-3-6 TaxID=2219864 RepID=UPI00137497C5|nr:gliding motility-associated C-terminal domain-containing protein [Sinomicrobium sp. N-1-3-6]
MGLTAVLAVSLSLQGTWGQTVNTGTMTIAPGTEVSTLGHFDNTENGDVMNDGIFYIYGNWNNDGLVSFTPGQDTGNTLFQGIYGKQRISGNMPSDFYNILFDNPASQPAFELSGDISISGLAGFKDGIVDGDAFGGLVTFQQGATHDRVADQSFVDGQVRKIGNEAFVYPIGDEKMYRRAATTGPANPDDHFTSQYILENSDTRYPHLEKEVVIDRIDDAEYWEINRTNGNSSVVLTLSWDNRTTPAGLLAEETGRDLHIVRWDEISGQWVDEGGVANVEEKTVTTAVSGYGIFTFAKVLVEDTPEHDLIVYNGVSPNGDGRNDFFFIKGLERYPDNTVEIYNRWGVKVYEGRGYDNSAIRFDGYSHGRATVNSNKMLPTGTYFYIIKYKEGNATRDLSGYLYIN